ncbi:hypothetical protein [Protaetiibacter mangrovi]|uniref:Uncharacterized protein n=1 Tax=Protaetiibacter mangrovi TaxID=2970926 RepID=A0ABT1ZIA9_9MICO|nr:hypothetical protein [Protaetiibacter mangrovi]MCS0500460.1 hypothetical protein [Protaetiibacter mangrovi]
MDRRTPESDGERQRRRRARNVAREPWQVERDRRRLRPGGLKTCARCRRSLPFHAFPDRTRERDGLDTRCYGCIAAARAARA